MEMQDKTQFEKEWENAFADAEMDVSASVWEKVELGVSQASAGKYKRRLLLFQLLAAASVAFAMSVGGVAVYYLQLNEQGAGNDQVAMKRIDSDQRNSSANDNEAGQSTGQTMDSNGHSPEVENSSSEGPHGYEALESKEQDVKGSHTSENQSLNIPEGEVSGNNNNSEHSGSATSSEDVDDTKATMAINDNDTDKLKENSRSQRQNAETMVVQGDFSENQDQYTSVAFDDHTASSPASHIAEDNELPEELDRLFEYLETAPLTTRELEMVPWYSYVPSKKSNNSDDLWAGIGFSAGSFNPNMSDGSASGDMMTMAEVSQLDASSKRAPSFSKEKAGQAYNIGINFGTKLSEKWVLQSGIVYAQQQTTSTSNVVSTTGKGSANKGSAKTLNNFSDMEAAEDISFTVPYDVNNTYELVSVPIQAGYVLLDNKFNIIILSGIANNILLKNQISASDGDIADVNVSAGESSQYRTYQLSGLFGTEFSYDFGSHYRLAVIPQVKQSLNSVTKSDSEYISRPTTLEIGFRFKYVFNN